MSPELDKGVLKQIEQKARKVAERSDLNALEHEDLRQDMAVEVLESLRRYDPAKGRLHAFVAKVLRQKAYRFLRHRYGNKAIFQNRMLSLDAHAPDTVSVRPMVANLARPSADDEMSETDRVLLACDLEEAIKALPPEQAVVCQKLMEGLNQDQTAAVLGISISTLRTRILHIRQVFEARGLETYLIDNA